MQPVNECFIDRLCDDLRDSLTKAVADCPDAERAVPGEIEAVRQRLHWLAEAALPATKVVVQAKTKMPPRSA